MKNTESRYNRLCCLSDKSLTSKKGNRSQISDLLSNKCGIFFIFPHFCAQLWVQTQIVDKKVFDFVFFH